MAAGCKPAAPCELRRFESSPVHQKFIGVAGAPAESMQLKHKLVLALVAYAVIALLAWQTLSEPKLRAFVWVLMAFFAAKSLLYWFKHTQSSGE